MRRMAEAPRLRAARTAPAHAYSHDAPPSTTFEPTEHAAPTGRPGDTPQITITRSDQHRVAQPPQPYDTGPSDNEARAHLRAIATLLRSQNPQPEPQTEHDLNELDAALALGSRAHVEDLVSHLTNTLDTLNEGEHGISNEDAAALEEPLTALTDFGFRAPYEVLADYYQPEPEPDEYTPTE